MTSPLRADVRRVLMLELQLAKAARVLEERRSESRRLSSRERAAASTARAEAKAERQVQHLEKELAAALAKAPASQVAVARAALAVGTEGKPKPARNRAPERAGPVEVSRVAPTARPDALYRRCGKPALLRSGGECGPCLRASGRTPCASCGVWFTEKERRRHQCTPARQSVRTVSGGAPGLGAR